MNALEHKCDIREIARGIRLSIMIVVSHMRFFWSYSRLPSLTNNRTTSLRTRVYISCIVRNVFCGLLFHSVVCTLFLCQLRAATDNVLHTYYSLQNGDSAV